MATQPNYRGALTHYLCHPESFTYKLPDNMDMMEGALVEPAAVGLYWFDDVASVQMPGSYGYCRR